MFDVELVKDLFKTESNTAYFWSGLGANNAERNSSQMGAMQSLRIRMIME